MHGTTAAFGAAGLPIIELGYHRLNVSTLGDVVAVPTVIAEDIVIPLEVKANPSGNSFLSQAEVNRRLHFIFVVKLVNLEFHLLYLEHNTVKFSQNYLRDIILGIEDYRFWCFLLPPGGRNNISHAVYLVL
jgi:hypothetical protein